jgi:predicted metalloendopeptidase
MWWSHASIRGFDERALCIINDWKCGDVVNYGQQTLTEDIADLVGVQAAYEAYFFDYNKGKTSSKAEKQIFFYSFSQLWCSSHSQCGDDVHADPSIRVDTTLRNLKNYFVEAFSCPVHGSLYMTSKENKCLLYS